MASKKIFISGSTEVISYVGHNATDLKVAHIGHRVLQILRTLAFMTFELMRLERKKISRFRLRQRKSCYQYLADRVSLKIVQIFLGVLRKWRQWWRLRNDMGKTGWQFRIAKMISMNPQYDWYIGHQNHGYELYSFYTWCKTMCFLIQINECW